MATWNSAFLLNPKSLDTPTQGDDEIRTLKAAIQERIDNEHTTYDADATGGVAALDWLHKAGSAVGYYLATGSAPAVGLSGSPLTAGQLWYDTTLSLLKIWTGAAWVAAAAVVDLSTTLLLTKVLDIGDWNMDTTSGVDVAHGLTLSKIRGISGVIRNDLDTVYFPITATAHVFDTAPGSPIQVAIHYAIAANVRVTRLTGGGFDNVNYDSVAYNRGWITIWYVP